ncbi:MAG TPA: hypothetical protein H9815_19765 [Candidatus Ruania gallistercoris]|uniref:Uncharacterized protein n=1 Tax=Candidatus Ruania gallistercoris TaxID=2838746 RepID=A0A9D2J656_9MICO|nr:hypothetical protein [Candidatus Ruania gallistercoris]
MRALDALAGALLVNALPHMIVGLTGQRGMTPFGGADSSPAANLAWAGINVAAGTAALAPWALRSASPAEAEDRLRGVAVGTFVMAAFGMVYELSPAAQRHREQRTP